jgi:hypothetical protein
MAVAVRDVVIFTGLHAEDWAKGTPSGYDPIRIELSFAARLSPEAPLQRHDRRLTLAATVRQHALYDALGLLRGFLAQVRTSPFVCR